APALIGPVDVVDPLVPDHILHVQVLDVVDGVLRDRVAGGLPFVGEGDHEVDGEAGRVAVRVAAAAFAVAADVAGAVIGDGRDDRGGFQYMRLDRSEALLELVVDRVVVVPLRGRGHAARRVETALAGGVQGRRRVSSALCEGNVLERVHEIGR